MGQDTPEPRIFRVLSLDGGGAKGFYTLGALKEIEALVGCPLSEKFDLIYGTSTGAIIAALLGIGRSVDEVESLYRAHVVTIMARWLPCRKTAALEALAAEVFGTLKFDAFRTGMGIVGTRWKEERPIIFKTNANQAFLGKSTFEPGFGCTISDAVVGSCSAYPFFKKKFVTTSRGERIEVRDGGFVANNPTLYAIVDATESLGFSRADVRVVSIGVGEYGDMWVACFNWVVTADQANLTTGSGLHWLVRDDDAVCWPSANFKAFTSALKKFWES
ncbi:patatin-like phospholipase/acyl hydrolase [Bradyrhizobium sp. USDA 4341]